MSFFIRKSKQLSSITTSVYASNGIRFQIPYCMLSYFNVSAPFTRASSSSASSHHHHHDSLPMKMDFPVGDIEFTSKMSFLPESAKERVHCYRRLSDDGTEISSSDFVKVSKQTALKVYTDMVTLHAMDAVFYEAQRQGRISFYVTTTGEEAINIALAAALTDNDDIIVPQYREPGALLWHGFTIQEFANQCFGNKFDYGKGRQMPVHYGSNKHNYFTVASTIASQLPHVLLEDG